MDIRSIFRRRRGEEPEPQPLAIEGAGDAPLTPEPDDAELAAQALLEIMANNREPITNNREGLVRRPEGKVKAQKDPTPTPPLKGAGNETDGTATPSPSEGRGADRRGGVEPDTLHDARYFKTIASKIRTAHEAARLRTMRFVAFCEQELRNPHLPVSGPGSLGLLEAELLKRIDVIERYGGELKSRWQHCLAMVTVRLMQRSHTDDDTDTNTDSNTNDNDILG